VRIRRYQMLMGAAAVVLLFGLAWPAQAAPDASDRAAIRAAARAALSSTGGHPSDAIYPQQDLPLNFSHQRHLELGAQCSLCHVAIDKSADARDRNLPGHAQCGICHLMDLPAAAEMYPPAACETCHSRFQPGDATPPVPVKLSFPPARITFSHELHLAQGVPCLECHSGVVAAGLATREHLPAMSTCLRCHDGGKAPSECSTCHLQGEGGLLLTGTAAGGRFAPRGRFRPDNHQNPLWHRSHSAAARLAPESCSACHSASVCLDCHDGKKPPQGLHPADWVMTHGLEAGRRTLDCRACHDPTSFCQECHSQAAVTPGRFPGLAGDPSGQLSFHPVGWRGELGEIAGPEHHSHTARRSLETCNTCHEQSSCLECHSFINPHPRSWGDSPEGWRFGQGEGRVCLQCHRPGDAALDRTVP